MLLSDYLKLRNQQIGITTGIPEANDSGPPKNGETAKTNEEGLSFAKALEKQIEIRGGVDFSNHALKRINSRSIDMTASDRLERLNKGVELAAEKGGNETLVLVDSTAFLVSVKNNKVITTLSSEDLKGNVFTNIDSTVII